jgi:hypothetical protein
MNRFLTLTAGVMLVIGAAVHAQTSAPASSATSPDETTTQSPNWNSSYDSYQTYPAEDSRMTGSSASMDNTMMAPSAPTDMDESTMTSTTASMDSSRATGSSTKSMGKKKKSHKRPGSSSSPQGTPNSGAAPSSGTTTSPDSGSTNP